MNAYTLFREFWWLLFPIGFMIMGMVRTLSYMSLRKKQLEIINAYAAQGKDIPQSLNDAMKSCHTDRTY